MSKPRSLSTCHIPACDSANSVAPKTLTMLFNTGSNSNLLSNQEKQKPVSNNGIDSSKHTQRRKNSFTPPMSEASTLSLPPSSTLIPMFNGNNGVFSEFGFQEQQPFINHLHHFPLGEIPPPFNNPEIGKKHGTISAFSSRYIPTSGSSTISGGSTVAKKAMFFVKVK